MAGIELLSASALSDAVRADQNRPCLFGVAGPCSHPRCLYAHFETLRQANMRHVEEERANNR